MEGSDREWENVGIVKSRSDGEETRSRKGGRDRSMGGRRGYREERLAGAAPGEGRRGSGYGWSPSEGPRPQVVRHTHVVEHHIQLEGLPKEEREGEGFVERVGTAVKGVTGTTHQWGHRIQGFSHISAICTRDVASET